MSPWPRISARPRLSDGRKGRAIHPSCTSALAGRVYSAARQAASALHSTVVLQVFQAKMLTSEKAGLDAASFRDLHSATDLALAQSEAVSTSHKTLLLSHLGCLGLRVNFARSILSLSQWVLFLGTVIDSVQRTATVSAEQATWLLIPDQLILVWLSTEAVTSFHSPVLPFFPPCLLLLSRLISIEETLSARLSKLENYGFDQLVSQRNWYHLLNEKSGFWGTRLSWRDVRGRIYKGCMGEVANRMSGGSFCGGRWGYLPFRHHDNRYSADWIRLCPGLSENSEDGNSCPKPHKAARLDWSRGKSGQQSDWDYKPEYGCHHVETYGFVSENWWFQRPEWTERIKLWRYTAVHPKKHNKI